MENAECSNGATSVALLNAIGAIDALRAQVIGEMVHIQLPELEELKEQLRLPRQLTVDEAKVAIRLVKELARVVVKAVSYTAMHPDDVNEFVHLDDNLAPVLAIILRVVEKVGEITQSSDELLRWMPFALYASAFFVCGHLPAYDAMRCSDISGLIISACQRHLDQPSRDQVYAMCIEHIVSLASQGVAKDEWIAEHSINKYVLEWIVLQVGFPHLGGDVPGRLLALVFPLVDDLTDATQVPGARMLLHIVQNVTATELRWFTDVLLQVLRGAITTRKPATLNYFIETLEIVLDKISPTDEYQHYEAFLPRLLGDCSLSTDVEIRLIYTRHLRAMIKRLGAPESMFIVRYLQPLLKVLVASFDSVRSSLIQETLETLRVTIVSAWVRIPHHSEEILVAVLKAVALCEVFPNASGAGGISQLPNDDEKRVILELCEDIVGLLHDLDGPRIEALLKRVISGSKALKPFATRMAQQLSIGDTIG